MLEELDRGRSEISNGQHHRLRALVRHGYEDALEVFGGGQFNGLEERAGAVSGSNLHQ
jgi:hypothetical protein